MRWLLQELVDAATDVGETAGAVLDDFAQTAQEQSTGLMEVMTDAATSLASTATEAASGLASELGSTMASTVVAENAAAGHAIDSATAMPLLAEARGGAAGAGGMVSMGAEDGFVEPQPLHQTLEVSHSMWHGHGRMVSVLVFAHLAAFLYWLYLYVISRRHEASRKSEHARRVVKKFKCVYEFAVDRAIELIPGRKKPRPLSSPGNTSPRAAIGLMPTTTMAQHPPPGASANVSLKTSPSMTLLHKYLKGTAD